MDDTRDERHHHDRYQAKKKQTFSTACVFFVVSFVCFSHLCPVYVDTFFSSAVFSESSLEDSLFLLGVDFFSSL